MGIDLVLEGEREGRENKCIYRIKVDPHFLLGTVGGNIGSDLG